MPYIGNTPADKFLTLAKQSFSTSATTSYTLDSAVSSTQDIALFINNVRQSPVDAYTVSGTALTLTSATAGTDEMYCVYLGKTVGTVNPPNDSVGLNQLSATGTPSSSNFLRGDNSWTAVSGTTINNNADNRVITGSGTANTLEGEANLSFSGTQLLQGGQTSASTAGYSGTLQVNGVNDNVTIGINSFKNNDGGGNLVIGKSRNASVGSFTALQNNDVIGAIRWAGDDGTDYASVAASIDVRIDGTPGSNDMPGRMIFSTTADGSAIPDERMRIDSAGRILANTASPIDNNAAFSIKELANYPLATKVDATGNTQQIGFNNGNGHIGGITTNGTSTAFNTSSDYRLKENISYDFDATTRLKQLKPSRFNFKTDASKTVDGFLAHEVSNIIPEAITGSKDATETKQNVVLNANGTMIYNGVLEQDYIDGKADGNYPSDSTWIAEKEVPVYQSIDQAKLVPLLTKALQEAITKIETLETKVTALENK